MEDRRWINVTATGEATVTPDVAVVSFAVAGTGNDLAVTRDDVNRRSSDVLARLRQLGVGDGDLNAPDVAIHPEYDHRRGQHVVGYHVARHMTARVRSLDALGPILDGLVAAGANEVGGAEMSAEDPSAGERAALEAAVEGARAKAETLARAAGVRLGAVVRIEEEPAHGPGPIPKFRAMAAMEAADAPTDVVAGDLTVSRTIRAWFAIS
jgi:uncharacterized protein